MLDKINTKDSSPLIKAILERDEETVKDLYKRSEVLINKVDPYFRISPLMILLAKKFPLSYLCHENFNYLHKDRLGRDIFYYCQNEEQILFCLKKMSHNYLINKESFCNAKVNKLLKNILDSKSVYLNSSYLFLKDEIESHNNIVDFLKSKNIYSKSLIHLILKKSIVNDIFHFDLILYLEILNKFDIPKEKYKKIVDAYNSNNFYEKNDYEYFSNLEKLAHLVSKKFSVSKMIIQIFNSMNNDDRIMFSLRSLLNYLDRLNKHSVPNKATTLNSLVSSLQHCVNKTNCDVRYQVDLKKRHYEPKSKVKNVHRVKINEEYLIEVATNSYHLMNWSSDLLNCLYQKRDDYNQRNKIILALRKIKTKEIKYAIEIENSIVTRFLGHRNRPLNPEMSEKDLILIKQTYTLLYDRKIIKHNYETEGKIKKREKFFTNIYNKISYSVFGIIYFSIAIALLPLLLFIFPIFGICLVLYSLLGNENRGSFKPFNNK